MEVGQNHLSCTVFLVMFSYYLIVFLFVAALLLLLNDYSCLFNLATIS